MGQTTHQAGCILPRHFNDLTVMICGKAGASLGRIAGDSTRSETQAGPIDNTPKPALCIWKASSHSAIYMNVLTQFKFA